MNSITATHDIGNRTQRVAEWNRACEVADLLPDTGVCALINQQQVAIFYSRRLNEYFALSNYDPVGNANIMSRGIIGSLGEVAVVASPLYKQHYDLRSGACLEKPEYALSVYPIRQRDGWIEVLVA